MADEKPPSASADAGNPPVPAGAVSAEPMNLPPIPLEKPAPKPAPPVPEIAGKKDAEIKDTFRELIETIVFVVVLVLMLKTFLAEAFVIPTGSMADTLRGYHHKVVCEKCRYPNLINASEEADPQGNPPQVVPVVEYRCENCGYWNSMAGVRD